MTAPSEPPEPYFPPPPTAPPPNPYPVQQPYPYPYGGPQDFGYPYPSVPYPSYLGPPRPGTATGAAVLAFVLSGLLILLGALLVLGGSVATDIEDSIHSNSHIGLELALDGLLNFLAGGLLIGGGVSLLNRGRAGRSLLTWGAVITLGESVYWLTRFGNPHGATVWPLLLAALAIISVCLAFSGSATRWLTR